MSRFRVLCALVTAVATSAAAPLPRASAAPARPTPDAITHHVARIGGRAIPYSARAGTISLHDDKERLSARLFYVAYTQDGVPAQGRPVTFFYNGGPGSSTVWLHMGSFAPVRVATSNAAHTPSAPYRLIPNDDSLLDKSDLVFVDAPNTGFSRVVGAGEPKDFMGVDQDARAFSQFVQRYISAFGRWNSPKFLFGESYGTTRDCVLVNLLQEAGVDINGVVLLSSVLNFGLNSPQAIGGGDWAYVNYLPTEAATAWYHHKAGHSESLEAFVLRAEGFARGEYAMALATGADLNPAESERIVARLHEFLGLDPQYLRDSNLRVSYPRFQKALLRDENKIVGRYDGRFWTYELDGVAERPQWDPSDVGISGAFVGTFNHYVRDVLKYRTGLQYRPTAYELLGARWDHRHRNQPPPENVAPDLAEAMSQNPHLRVFSANGRYDFATPYLATVYTLEHLNIAPPLRRNLTFGFYPSGHMVYLNPPALVRFKADLARWYDVAS